eukprot:10964519-Lingulodinium_polyedra.AAC.1
MPARSRSRPAGRAGGSRSWLGSAHGRWGRPLRSTGAGGRLLARCTRSQRVRCLPPLRLGRGWQ